MRKPKFKRPTYLPDPKFSDTLVTRFVNNIMSNGKKNLAYTVFYKAIEQVKKSYQGENEKDGLSIWKRALERVMPVVEVKSRRVGGATFQVPVELSQERRLSLGMKWLIRYARQRSERTMSERLAHEILAAEKGEGGAVKRKEDTRRMAEANKAFSHFRF
ncbi:MAG: 30S ribosomal protein S7 [Cytophagales bacterium]|nr:30S ribosomal protein S7 [Cytophagales bacterium]